MFFWLHAASYWITAAALVAKDWWFGHSQEQSLEFSSSLPDAAMVLFNQCIISKPFIDFVEEQQLVRSGGLSCLAPFWLLPCYLVTEEVLFYGTHRLLHHVPVLYKWIHAWHHRWTITSFGGMALSAHPVEHFFANLLPVAAGPLIFGGSTNIVCFWILLATINSVFSHHGYSFQHSYHHLMRQGNYGILGLCDWFFGTSEPPLA